MVKAYIELGPVPAAEDCAQVGAADYYGQSRRECTAYARQLIRVFGQPPTGCHFGVKSFEHDFGTYREVCAFYDDASADGLAWAIRCENDLPEEWDEEARKELKL